MKIGHGENPEDKTMTTDHRSRINREGICCTAGILPASETRQEQARRLRYLYCCPRSRVSSMAQRSMSVHPMLRPTQPSGSSAIAPRSLRPPQRLSAFTVAELLVVTAIIGLLIALLMPAIIRARDLALQIACASNLRQIGVAMQEYSNEYGGYPVTNDNMLPFGGFRTSTRRNFVAQWGFSLLYNESFGVVNNQMVNVRPGILTPSAKGISMLFSTQPGVISQSNQIKPDFYDPSTGLLDRWDFYSGYCYWVDRGTGNAPASSNFPTGYSKAYDMRVRELAGVRLPQYNTWTYYNNTDTSHMPAENPQSNPGALLASDVALISPLGLSPDKAPPYMGKSATWGQAPDGQGSVYTPASNHVDTSNNNYLPDGVHELYNEGAVVWKPMSQVKVRTMEKISYGSGFYFAW